MPPPNEMTEVYLVKGAISMLNAKKLVQEIWSTVGRLEKWPARSRKSSSQTNKKLSRKVEKEMGKLPQLKCAKGHCNSEQEVGRLKEESLPKGILILFMLLTSEGWVRSY